MGAVATAPQSVHEHIDVIQKVTKKRFSAPKNRHTLASQLWVV